MIFLLLGATSQVRNRDSRLNKTYIHAVHVSEHMFLETCFFAIRFEGSGGLEQMREICSFRPALIA